ncbi:BREX-1 system adenine-specific DNA-methyltransferase PglX [Tepidibacter mesophilus]|uniref:BREX-1 system adenine-specific DNA-methyltransferase PglX n=1 Tax=Tepidibacter mesophilus TaxID=655607 RepID=UPI000C06F16E|nr:BREX-1 system adenine-specific DNA-methyltransferase PglX [Tepidibacter mesophilus]
MNKSAIKNFAINARTKLIDNITQKAYELGITKEETKEIETFEGGFRVKDRENSKIFKKHEIKQREQLIRIISEKGIEQVIEEVSYTWFNRFIALRFMEVNEYLPSGVRVLSSIEDNKTEPDIITEAENIDLDVDKEIIYRLLDNNETHDLYRYLLVKQCNELGKIMPYMFEEIADYTELLLPDNLLAENSIIRDLVDGIEEDDFKEEVEIIGWLYQYYISEKKDEVFAGLKKNKKITKENIPAATQLFTPKWIVKYMVENSLGRLWLESHPNEELKESWKYYLEEAEQEPEVKEQLEKIINKDLSPEDIKVLDPAMGSGHILVYAFDVLYDIYSSAGYSEREIPALILEKNLYGLDIDDRAGQLAYFALMMKARSKNRRIFRKCIDLNICSISESNGISKEAINYFANNNEKLKEDTTYLVDVFEDAKEYGSILNVEKVNFDGIANRLEEIRESYNENLFETGYKNEIIEKLPALIKQGRIMSEKYNICIMNPPYMGKKGMSNKLASFADKKYKKYDIDLFSVFIKVAKEYTSKNGFLSLITQPTWLNSNSFKILREYVVKNTSIQSMLHMGRGIFGIDFGSSAFTLRNKVENNYKGRYFKLFNRTFQYIDMNDIEQIFLYSKKNIYFKFDFNNYQVDTSKSIINEDREENEIKINLPTKIQYIYNQKNFKYMPDYVYAYTLSDAMIKKFIDCKKLIDESPVKEGINTGNNDRFLKIWHEVSIKKIGYNTNSRKESEVNGYRWFPHNKGGSYRKWYGNNDYVVDWMNDGYEIRNFRDDKGKLRSSLRNLDYFFNSGITYAGISSGNFSCRYFGKGFTFNSMGRSIFPSDKNIYYFISLLNSKVSMEFLKVLAPTLSFTVGAVGNIPTIVNENIKENIDCIGAKCINLSKEDWDSFETSWDFKKHPLLTYKQGANTIEQSFNNWSEFADNQFKQLKHNEEELNRIFIDIYGLQEELTPEVEDKDVTINKADEVRDIKSFISYVVGCMFGRYSLDEEGLVFAGGEFDKDRYETFKVDEDNVIPITDDSYFEDDIVGRFIEFVKITFGEETIEENLDYIADKLNKKSSETSRQAIRRYFLKDFYKDHLKTYKKKPIYWMFDSGKQDGFKALVYMHRYDSSTVARVRTDYLHELQKKYDSEMNRLDITIDSEVSAREKSAAKKKKDKISKQMIECVAYDEVIAHVADQKAEIDLDDGVNVNYAKFQEIVISQGENKKDKKANLLAKI